MYENFDFKIIGPYKKCVLRNEPQGSNATSSKASSPNDWDIKIGNKKAAFLQHFSKKEKFKWKMKSFIDKKSTNVNKI